MSKQMPTKTVAVRLLDNVGRISLPPKFLDYLDLSTSDTVLLYLNDEKKIVMKKHDGGCVLCGNKDVVIHISELEVCSDCREDRNNEIKLVTNRYVMQIIPNGRRMVIPFKIRHELGLHVESLSTSENPSEESKPNDKLTLELHEDYILMSKYENVSS